MTRDDVLAAYSGAGWDYIDLDAMADEIVRLRSILAALREPSEAVSEAGALCGSPLADDIISAAVAAAEQEVSNDPR